MKRPIAFSLGMLVVVLALGAIGYFYFLSAPTDDISISPETFIKLDALRRSANRDLENQVQLDVGAGGTLSPEQVASAQVKKLVEMAAPFTELANELPGETIGLRNQAVLWLLPQMPNGVNRQGLSTEDARLLDERATDSVEALLRGRLNEPETHMLAALLALRGMERQRGNREAAIAAREMAIAEFRKALEADRENVEAAYQLGLLLDNTRDGEPSAEAVAAFDTAFKIQPGNYYVLLKRLDMLVRTKSPDTATACRAVKSKCEAVRRRILRENDPDTDLIVLLDRAANAAEAGKWDEAAEALQVFDSWLTAIARDLGDLPEVTPHPLDYMVFEFSQKLREKFPIGAAPDLPVAMSFQTTTVAESQLESNPKQVRLLDFNLDNQLELAVLEAGRLSLHRRGEKEEWKKQLAAPMAGARGMAWGDLDRDEDPQIKGDYKADLDLIVYGDQGLSVFANQPNNASGERSLELLSTPITGAVEHAVLIDFDHDGDLDIVAALPGSFSLLLNLGNAQFEDVTAFSSIEKTQAAPVRKMVVVDFDRDGDLDVLTTCIGHKKPGFLSNTRHGQMRWREMPPGFGDLCNAFSLFVAELDGNGSWDLLMHTQEGILAILTEQTAEGQIRVKQRTQVPLMNSRLSAVADFDNDGRIDIVAFGALGGFFWRGDGMGDFGESIASNLFPPGRFGPQLQMDVDDIDQDGDLDIALADFFENTNTKGEPESKAILGNAINQGGNSNHWVSVRPRGAEDNVSGKVNHYGIGTLVEVRTGALYQAAISDRPSVHFGLGDAKTADQIRLIFTNGYPQSVLQSRLAGDTVIVEEMALKGSCPYVYTDAGAGWKFYSDCLWGAPIGMQYAEARLQPGRAWEYLKLPGELLQPQGGAYRVMLTEELWEATYIDHVSLLAIDHPGDVEIFTNEKVGPPSVAEHRIFSVSNRRIPESQKDLTGRDLARQLAAADGDFVQGWDKSFKQGLVEKHGLELDLGAFEPNANVVLYLTGWIMPTDTSLNVALTQHPDLEGPKPPSLSIYNEQGTLEEIIPMLGFPGGKTKTIAIDLTGKFNSNDHRVVISTTHQIYWDEAFFTLNDPQVEMETIPLALQSARMTYRGFSKKLPQAPRAPSMFDAAIVDKSPRWLPMGGGFTEFGDAMSLLTSADDRMAIIGGGDALELTFAAAPPPRPGWKRDFILHSVGWDKDADLNTFFGQTVGPMPVGPDGGYLGPAITKPGEEGSRIQPRARFWKQLVP